MSLALNAWKKSEFLIDPTLLDISRKESKASFFNIEKKYII